MTRNILVTGPPRSGKTTAIRRTVAKLPDPITVGGISSPELRVDDERVGFELVDETQLRSTAGLRPDRSGVDTEILAHVERFAGPKIGKYRVKSAALDDFGVEAIARARKSADVVIIDEIGPMQLTNDAFVCETSRAFDSPTPVLAAIIQRSSSPVVEDLILPERNS